ncbi:MAG: S-adenosylmethionine:tRNA ribosyltransferase-isomerase [Desulfovibrio sp.]|nr:S-adenosylmethionine:tRNA ribosyltransferase-isomerase [Desulfovibrio sp.]
MSSSSSSFLSPSPREEADFLLQSYQFALPAQQIAQYPSKERGRSRLLVMPRTGDLVLKHKFFQDLPSCLPPRSLLVANNSRVLQARLLGRRGDDLVRRPGAPSARPGPGPLHGVRRLVSDPAGGGPL